MSSRSRQQLEEWLKSIEVEGHVLDIGGSQNPISGSRCKSWGADTYTIIDLPEPHELKRPADISLDIQDTDIDGENAQYKNWVIGHTGFFDQVFCLEVSEYWHDPMQALRNINKLMKLYGTLYISFHWLYGLHPPEERDCLRYSIYAIQEMLEKTGFQMDDVEIKTISEEAKEYLLRFYHSEGMRVTRVDRSLFHEGYLVKAIKV